MPNFRKRIDISQMACVEKLERFQSAVQAIDLVESLTLQILLLRLCMK